MEFCRIFGKTSLVKLFPKFNQLIGKVMNRYSNGLGCLMPCESLDGFWETGTYLRARDDCHVSTFLSRGMTANEVKLPKWKIRIDIVTKKLFL